jgi:hypothetical protein
MPSKIPVELLPLTIFLEHNPDNLKTRILPLTNHNLDGTLFKPLLHIADMICKGI